MTLTPTVPRAADSNRVTSAWGNEIRDRTLQVFASVAERDAQWSAPPNGAEAITLDTNTLWLRRAGAWSPILNLAAGSVASGDSPLPSGGVKDICTSPTLPAWSVASMLTVVWACASGFGTAVITATPSTTVWSAAQNTLTGKIHDCPNGKWVYSSLTQSILVPAGSQCSAVGTITLSAQGYCNGTLSWVRTPT